MNSIMHNIIHGLGCFTLALIVVFIAVVILAVGLACYEVWKAHKEIIS